MVILLKFMWFFVFYVIFSVFILKKWKFPIILSAKWVVKNKVSKLLHYSFSIRVQGHFSRILNCEWLFWNLTHCHCPKISFKLLFSWLLHNGSSHQHSIIGKKLNIVSWHIWWRQHFLFCFSHFWEISNFFCLPVLMLKKWNFKVTLSLNDKSVVKRLTFGS